MTQTEIKKLDAIFSAIVCKENPCVKCGNYPTEPHHLIKRKYLQVRWDRENVWPVCRECHRKAHDHPLKYEEFALARLGRKKFFELKQRAYVKTFRKLFYEDILAKLEGKCVTKKPSPTNKSL